MIQNGVIAAIAALLTAAFWPVFASADEASVKAALTRHSFATTVGISSYYGPGFHGRPTADGEIFDMHALTAAHKTLPIPSYARVTNLRNGHSVIVRINDRGPYIAGRMLDVSARVARLLDYNGGLERVKLEYLGMAGPEGAADQRALLASLKTGEAPVIAKAKPTKDNVLASLKTGDEAPAASGVTVAPRSPPALAFASAKPAAPAAAALEAAVRPVAPAEAPLSLAAKLDASARQMEAALEAAHARADAAVKTAVAGASPFGKLVISPFKPLVEALR